MSSIFERIPEVSFIDNLKLEDLQGDLINEYQNRYRQITGNNDYILPKSSPYRLIINAIALQMYQGFMWLDNMGKMNLLKYARGAYLDNFAIAFGLERKKGEPSKTKIRFSLSNIISSTVSIPAGTRCTNGKIYFKTISTAEIKSGTLSIDLDCICTENGTVGNGFSLGEINVLVDSIPYIEEVKNITISDYGTEIESDEDLRNRIYLASSTYSVAGPIGAYEYLVREYSTLISDVKITNPSPRVVDIRIILKNGEKPREEFCRGLENYLSASDKRPLTDLVQVGVPQEVFYNINLTYYISESDKSNLSQIQKNIEEAVENYIDYQESKIGRDINPSQLIRFMTNAGAKRVEIMKEPYFTQVSSTSIAKLKTKLINYGGIEDD